jgi:hypothetical protein
MREVGEILGVFTRPFDLRPETLSSCFQSLCEAPYYYQNVTPPDEKSAHREVLIEALDCIEFQAAWHVLRGLIDDPQLHEMGAQTRRALYLEVLYGNPERYPFFAVREQVIRGLSRVGVIRLEDYTCPSVLAKAKT